MFSAGTTLTINQSASPTFAGTIALASGATAGTGGGLAKLGGGTLEIDGGLSLGTNSSLAVNGGKLLLKVTSGAASVGSGVTANITGSAVLELAGSVSALGTTTPANRVGITNSSNATAGLLISDGNQQVGAIDGSGTTQINAGSDLMANHIIQSALVIGGTAGSPGLVTIDASDASGNPLGQSNGFVVASSLTPSGPFKAGDLSTANFGSVDGTLAGNPALGGNLSPVPEPSTLLLALLAVLGVVSIQFVRHHFRWQTV